MRRRMFNIATVASLLVCAVLVALWGRSYFAYDHLSRAAPQRAGGYLVRSHRGYLYFERRSIWHMSADLYWHRGRSRADPVFSASFRISPPDGKSALGFGYYAGSDYSWPGHLHPNVQSVPPITDPRWWKDDYRGLFVPYWFGVVLAVLLPCHWMRSRATWKRQWRVRRGRCGNCGYDLRATPDRCPECGTEAVAR